MRHFLARFFDTEIGALRSDWQKVGIGILATFLSASILLVKKVMERYDPFVNPSVATPERNPSMMSDE